MTETPNGQKPKLNGISLPTPFGPLAATGASAIMGVLLLGIGMFLYREMDKIGDEFEAVRVHIDQRFKQIEDVQRYNACLSRLTLWRSQRPREELTLNFDLLPEEFYYCLPGFMAKKGG